MLRVVILLLLVVFQNQLIHAQSSNGDFTSAILLCNQSPVIIESVPNAGEDNTEIATSGNTCFGDNFRESNSVWFKWRASESGQLGFTILPFNENDDIDFLLYKLPNGISNCEGKEVLRCIAAGSILGDEEEDGVACTGATGLSDMSELADKSKGCSNENNNFLAEVEIVQGESYALLVHNYKSTGGFALEFTGSASFEEFPGICSSSTTSHEIAYDKVEFSDPFPNPSNARVRIDYKSSEPIDGILQIIDLRGRILSTKPLSYPSGQGSITLNTDNIPQGNYFLKISYKTGSHVAPFVKG